MTCPASLRRLAAKMTSRVMQTAVFVEGDMRHRRFAAVLMLITCAALLTPQLSLAQAAEIRLARQFSMGYLQFNVMEHQQLIEKHARAPGLADVQASRAKFNQ